MRVFCLTCSSYINSSHKYQTTCRTTLHLQSCFVDVVQQEEEEQWARATSLISAPRWDPSVSRET